MDISPITGIKRGRRTSSPEYTQPEDVGSAF